MEIGGLPVSFNEIFSRNFLYLFYRRRLSRANEKEMLSTETEKRRSLSRLELELSQDFYSADCALVTRRFAASASGRLLSSLVVCTAEN